MSTKSIKVDDYEKSTAEYFELIKNTKPLTKKEEKLLLKNFLEKNDFSARKKLIEANLKFVPTVAKEFKGYGLPFADIIEEGNIGLIKAIDRFDPKHDTKIISYAIWGIRKCIFEAIEKKSMLDTENIDDIYKQCCIQEKGEQLDEDSKQIIINEDTVYDDDKKETYIHKQIIEQLFDGITERERDIITDYYGLDNCTPKTLDEIGLEINLTKERVRQLNEKALKKMRSNALIKNLNFSGF